MKLPRLLISIAATSSVLLSAPLYASTITVNTTTDELNADGDCSLREAIQAANTNLAVDACTAGTATPIDEIIIPAGTYTLTRAGANENANSTGDLDINQSVTLTGGSTNRDLTIIQAGTTAYAGIDRVFHVVPGVNRTIIFRNLTIQNGCANGGTCNGAGGAVESNSGGSLDVINCAIQYSRGTTGGGLHPYSGDTLVANVTDTILRNNTASVLGGGFCGHNTTSNLTRVVVTGNTTLAMGNGAGIGVSSGTTRLVNSTVANNTSLTHGGGIAVAGFANTSFGTLIATNSTLSGNTAEGNGGGLFVSGGVVGGVNYGCSPNACRATLNSVTITNNVADNTNTAPTGDGGGVFVTSTPSNPGSLTVRNTLVAVNTDRSGAANARPDCSGTLTSQNYNFVGTDSGCTFTTQSGDRRGTSASPLNPLLGPLANNGGTTDTHLPANNSPLYDAGNSTGCTDDAGQLLTTDQRGFPRAQPARCDIGSVEIGPVCGNGIAESGEQCDGSICCASDCRFAPATTACVDNNVCTAIDHCSGTGAGASACIGTGSVCGNGTLNTTCGEQCDDGNVISGDRCSATCQVEAVCGNGILESGEQCDGGPCCRTNCQFATAGTSCNDGNTCTAVDTCNGIGGGASSCIGNGSVCGNGVLNATCGEQCDDGNIANGDSCSSTCQTTSPVVCGNAVCDVGENFSNCPADCPVTAQMPNLRLTSVPSRIYPAVNQNTVFTLTYSNIGSAIATGVVITADIPLGSTFSTADSAPTVWSCANATPFGNLCTTTVGTVAVGATGTVRFGVVMNSANRLYQSSTITDDLTHGPDADVTNNGVTFLNSQSYRSVNVGPTRFPANISHVLVPSNYDGTQELPLVLLLHGLSSAGYASTLDAAFDFRFSRGVETRGYFLLMGKGTGAVHANTTTDPYTSARPSSHWNATDICCARDASGNQRTPETDVDDVAYLREAIEQAIDVLNVDFQRIYSVGFSNGSFMSYRLACEMPNLITAVATVAGATYQTESMCVGADPVSVLHIHGTADAAVRFYDFDYDHDNNPATPPILERPDMPGAVQTLSRWAAKAGCDIGAGALVTGTNINLLHPHNRASPATPAYTVGAGSETITRRYGANCRPGYAFELWEMPDQDHALWFEYDTALLNGAPFPTDQILNWLFARQKP